jgi:hypothetical protein
LLPFAGGSLPEIRQSGSRSQNEAASSSVKVRATRENSQFLRLSASPTQQIAIRPGTSLA